MGKQLCQQINHCKQYNGQSSQSRQIGLIFLMSILQILGSGFLVLVLWLVLQQYKSNLSVFVVVAFGVLIFLSMAGQFVNNTMASPAKAAKLA